MSSAIVGDNIGYLLGRRLGRDVLEAKGPFQEYRLELIATGDRFFAKHGPKAVFFARWIALVRFAAAWLAGINHMRFREFFFWNALGGITWGVTYGLVGYFAGSAAADAISTFGLYAFAAAARRCSSPTSTTRCASAARARDAPGGAGRARPEERATRRGRAPGRPDAAATTSAGSNWSAQEFMQ